MTNPPDPQFGFRGDRVRRHTAPEINRRITQTMQTRVKESLTNDPRQIEDRIEALDQEWDIERVLELNASAAALTGLLLGVLTGRRKWFLLPAAVLPFLMQHAVQGWCPPVPLLRRLGLRTQREIEAEKYALKALQKEEANRPAAEGGKHHAEEIEERS